MRSPDELTPGGRSALLQRIQDILWRDARGKIDPDKSWSTDELDEIARAMADYGLDP